MRCCAGVMAMCISYVHAHVLGARQPLGVAARRVLAILHLLDMHMCMHMSRHTAEAGCAGRGAEAGELERLISHGRYDFLFS